MLTVSACKKNTPAACGSGLLCATVDGTNYTGDPYSSTSSGFLGLNTNYNGSYAQLIINSGAPGGYNLNVSSNNGNANTSATWQIDFEIKQLPSNGATYTSASGAVSFDYYDGSISTQFHYITDSAHTGTVTINNIDTINNLVSGTFSYTANEPTGQNYTPATHQISAGSFTNLLIRR